jgi:SAM-dependent methyltransferase
MSESGGAGFGPGYYAASAESLGWGPGHSPDAHKLRFLGRHVVGALVLDVGCGPGVYAAALARQGRRVVGLDFSRALLKSRGARGEWNAVCASAFDLPLRDGAADTTLLLSILEHVDDAALLREAVRVTRGRIIVQVPLAEPAAMLGAGLLFSHWMDRSHLRTYTEESLGALAAGAGCRVGAWESAYPRDLHELYLDTLAVPRLVRRLVGAVLRPVRRLAFRPRAEAFAVLERA